MEFKAVGVSGKGHYLYRGYIYIKVRTKNGVTYFRCREPHCTGRANEKDGEVTTSGIHYHMPDNLGCEMLEMKEVCCKEGAKVVGRPSVVYRHAVRKFPHAANFIPYHPLLRKMRKVRSAGVPRIPSSISEIATILEDPQWDHWRKDLVGTNNFFRQYLQTADGMELAMFFPECNVPLLKMDGVMFLIDGTFKTVPYMNGAYQLVTLHVVIGEGPHPMVFPSVFFIASGKTRIIYDAMLEALQQHVGDLRPASVMCDFEEALRGACEQAFMGIQITSCWFHFSQAVHRKAGELRLFPIMKRQPNAKKIVAMTMALPLLPALYAMRGFQRIRQFAAEHNMVGRFTPFLNYVQDQWFQRVNPIHYSVYRHAVRTNNAAERFHLSLLEGVGTRPNFWVFYDFLRESACEQTAKLNQHKNGLPTQKPQAASDRQVDESIHRLWDRLDHKEGYDPITPEHFINAASYLVGSLQDQFLN